MASTGSLNMPPTTATTIPETTCPAAKKSSSTTLTAKAKKSRSKNAHKAAAAAAAVVTTEDVVQSMDLQKRLQISGCGPETTETTPPPPAPTEEVAAVPQTNGHDVTVDAAKKMPTVEPSSAASSVPSTTAQRSDAADASVAAAPAASPAAPPVSSSEPSAAAAPSTPIDPAAISYVIYQNELQMPDIMRVIQKDLSEPYSIYTYRYFIHNWPKLCFLAMHGAVCVGAIVCKLDIHRQTIKRGYIAMLAVDKDYRKLQIGTKLVHNAIQAMLSYDADEVVLETEITNTPALRLYENLGFVRDKRLFGYYLNGVDALRLKLWFR